MRTAEIIAIGSELLLGGRLDTNSLVLTEGLASVGVEVRFKTAVGDDEADIVAAIRTAGGRASVVILTGGLGPTRDDRTREAVARVTRRRLQRRSEAVSAIRTRLAIWGRAPNRAQLKQAMVPAGADLIANPIGTAAGFQCRWKGCHLAALPGVPGEMQAMFRDAVLPRLRLDAGPHDHVEWRLFHTFGLPEADVDQRCRGLGRAGIRLGTLASPLGVTVSLTVSGGLTKARRAMVEQLTAELRRLFGEALYAEGNETMEIVVGRHLRGQGLMLAVAESCTGGLIGHRLTQVAGSSDYLDRVVVCYSNRAKMELLRVPAALIEAHGAVSAEVAAAMAHGVRALSGVPLGLSVTGIAGPGGGTAQKPVGLVYVGLDGGDTGHPMTHEFRFHGDREAIKLRASQAALNVARAWLGARKRD